MKAVKLTFCFLTLLTLSACSNTWEGIKADMRSPNDRRPPPQVSQTKEGVKADWQDLSDWTHGRPSHMAAVAGPIPSGYAGQNEVANSQFTLLKPSGVERVEQSSRWEDVGSLDRLHPVSMPIGEPPMDEQAPEVQNNDDSNMPQPLTREPISYNDDVHIYPVDGDAEPYGGAHLNEAANNTDNSVYAAPAGKMAEQVFFPYGSAKVEPVYKESLRSLSNRLKASRDYDISVVGHASKRVDNVEDPIRRKMINLSMAQKRSDAVTSELHKAGVNPAKVKSISRGDEEPNPTPDGKPQEEADRRVEVFVDEK